jgi:hypothetical protein
MTDKNAAPEKYTPKELTELHFFCADLLEVINDTQKRTEVLLYMKHIDAELVMQEQKQSAYA